jgi:hypothetical protein
MCIAHSSNGTAQNGATVIAHIVKMQVKSAAQNRIHYTPVRSHWGIVIIGK